MSDMATSTRVQAVERATGPSWDEWLKYLTRIGASERSGVEPQLAGVEAQLAGAFGCRAARNT
jgi:hypothetical protein